MPRVVWVLLALVLATGTAMAERVRTTKSTKVYKRTGEQSDVVTKVAAGKTLNVVAKQGRWLKVRVNGRTGWVTQSSVVSLEARDLPRNTRRRPFVDGRSTRRGWGGGAPDDRVGADAVEDDDRGDAGDDDDDGDGDGDGDGDETGRGSRASDDDDDDDQGGGRRRASDGDDDGGDDGGDDDDDGDDGDDEGSDEEADDIRRVTVTAGTAKIYPRASKKAKAAMTVRRGASLVVLDEHESGKWIRVEDDEGSAGWIASSAVSDDAKGPPRKARTIGARARLGFASVGGNFSSNAEAATGANPPPDYGFGSTAVSLAVGGEVIMAMKKDYFIGGGLEYLGCIATPGIRYAANMMAEDIGFKTHDLDVRLLAGYDFHNPNGMTAWARLGYHYGVFSVENLENLAKIPAETFSGPTVGAAVRIPALTSKIGAEAALDLVYPGKRKQTVGITDGTMAKAKAATLELTGTYAWKGPWRLGGAYQFGYASTSWSGDSERIAGATASKRVDLSHVLTVGLGRDF